MIAGSRGLSRIARENRSSAAWRSPHQFLMNPPKYHASAKLEFIESARSIKVEPACRSEAKYANAQPLSAQAVASSLPDAFARSVSRLTSRIASAVHELQPHALADT